MKRRPQRQRRDGRRRAPDGAGQPRARVLGRRGGVLLEPYQRAEARDEHRSGGRDAVAAERDDVTHLVDVDREDQPQRELPAVERGVDPQSDGHREEGLRLRQTDQQRLPLAEQQQDPPLELGEQDADRPDAGGGLRTRRALRLLTGGAWVSGRHLGAQGLDLGEDARVLGRLRRQKLQHPPPGFQRAHSVPLPLGRLRIGRELLELGGVNQPAAIRAGEERPGDLGAALRADARSRSGGRHGFAPGGPPGVATRGGAAGPNRNGPDSGTRRLIFQAS